VTPIIASARTDEHPSQADEALRRAREADRRPASGGGSGVRAVPAKQAVQQHATLAGDAYGCSNCGQTTTGATACGACGFPRG
jgi:hypothetical protein